VSGPAGFERIDLAALPTQLWKNGAGLTREVATHPPGAGLDDFDWRLSVAEVARDGLFSAFAGVDRQLVLLDGVGMRLRSPDGALDCWLERPGDSLSFAGEAQVAAELTNGPTRDFNVMTRRGRWHAELHALQSPGEVAAADAALLLCCAGTWTVEPVGVALERGQGLLWRAPVAPLFARATSPGAWLLSVRLCQHPTP
jgi:environmental stress-induced protein Ves